MRRNDQDHTSRRRAALASACATAVLALMMVPGTAHADRPSPTAPAATGTYTVKNGDNLAGIARKLGVTLDALLAANGLTVTTDEGALGEVPPGVQLTICTVIREALANTLRHAGPTSVDVALHRDSRSITVDIRDAGLTPQFSPSSGTGNGLRGLRERLAIHHGTLTTGPTDTGFRLLAQIPMEAS